MSLPPMFRLRQRFERPRVPDVAGSVRAELSRLRLGERVRSGDSIAITAGSRGIAGIAEILRAAVEFCQGLGARPYLVAAMGSHGGGTEAGQRAILASYGITETSCGCPIRARMETVVLDHTPEGVPVHFGRDALEADHVLIVGRVKPHTELFGDHQSGLMKMLLIGLGKHEGARIYHRAFQEFSFDQIVRSVGLRVLRQGRVLAGIGIVENAFEETALIRGVGPEEFETQDRELLALSRRWLARLPFDRADLLVVDEIGKEISGCGMDTNVTGRKRYEHGADEQEFPKIKRIAVRGLSRATHGNATGLGKAEFCLTRVVDAIDRRVTYMNSITACYPQAAMIPPHYDNDREMLQAALSTVGLVEPRGARVMWIRNTLALEELECSEAFLAEARTRENLEILSPPQPLAFDDAGMRLPLEPDLPR